jgi:non-specific serine/threonine protein kinase
MRSGSSRRPFGYADLPAPLADLIGREHESEELRALLTDRGARVIVLTGTAGVGKTALAVHVLWDVARGFDGRILFIPLAALRDPALVIPTIAQRLGVSTVGPEEEGRQRLLARIRERPLLLALDNLEHLLGAREPLVDLLEACPDLRVLITSRVALRISGEWLIEIRPLAIPSTTPQRSHELRANPAVALFLRRAGARATNPAAIGDHLDDVAEICRRLDGLPLAIELAAARSRSLPPPTLRSMLVRRLPLLVDGSMDLPPRLRSLQDAIAWSYDLLDETHRQLFRRLAIFEGGFALHAAQAIVRGWVPADGYPMGGNWEREPQPWWVGHGHEAPPDDGSWTPPSLRPAAIDATTGLQVLVDHSLVRSAPDATGEARFELLETIREFGLARLDESAEGEAVRHAHAVYFVELAEACGMGLWRSNHKRWCARLEVDLGNVRAAQAWLASQPGAANQLSLRLAESLWPFWQTRGSPKEGLGWLKTALAREEGTPAARVNAFNVAGLMAWYGDDAADAQDLLSRGLPLAREIGYRVGAGRNLSYQALLAWRRRQTALMGQLGREAVEHLRAWEAPSDVGVALILLAVIAREAGDIDEASRHLAEAGALFAAIDFPWGLAAARFYAGEVARDRGDTVRSAELLQDGLTRFWDQEDLWGTGGCVASLALLVADRAPVEAVRLLGAAKAMTARSGSFLLATEDERYARRAVELRTILGAEAFGAAFNAGLAMPAADAIAEARALSTAILDGGAPIGVQTIDVIASGVGQRLLGRLTPKQAEAFWLLVEGHDAQAIAHRLNKSYSAINERLVRVRRVFGVDSDVALVAKAAALGLVRRPRADNPE